MSENSDIFNGLDGYYPLPRFKRTCCIMCKHFHGVDKGSCEAYPAGIPDKFAVRNQLGWGTVHSKIEPGQIGDYLFEIKRDEPHVQ